MGWCSATEIMDAALEAAEGVAATLREEIQRDPGKGRATAEWDVQQVLDEALRPFVVRIATHLRDGDWDCIDESAYFDRFPQEMLGYDDNRYAEYLLDKLRDCSPGDYDFPELVRKLAELTKRMENTSNGG